MSYLESCIESCERRERSLAARLAPLESGEVRIGLSVAGAPFECATATEIDLLRHELREVETIIAALRNRRARAAAALA